VRQFQAFITHSCHFPFPRENDSRGKMGMRYSSFQMQTVSTSVTCSDVPVMEYPLDSYALAMSAGVSSR